MDRTIAEKQTYADRDDQLWAVVSVIPAAGQITLRTAKGISRIETIQDFQHLIIEGDLRLVSGPQSTEARTAQNLVELTPNQRQKLDHRKRIVDYILARLNKGKTWVEIETELRSEDPAVYGKIPSRRQLHRYVDASRKGQLLPGKPGWRRGRPRVADEVVTALEVVIKRLMASGARELVNLQTLQHHVHHELHRNGHGVNTFRVSLKTLKCLLAQRAAWGEDLRSYLDRRAYRAATRVAVKSMDATRPLELVEIDALIPSFHFFTPEGERIGPPTIYVAIDVATGVVLGIKAYAMAPGVEPLLDFYEHMFFPKPPRPDGWNPPWGRPERILSDQGSEFVSSFSAGVAFAMGYEHLYAEGEAGWKKPHVERFNGEIQTRYLNRTAGSTKSSATGKIDPDLPLRTGGPTLEKLNEGLQSFAWDIHARETSDRLRIKHRDADITPATAWDTLSSEYPPMLPFTRETFRKATYEFIGTGKLGHDGVHIDNLDYHSAPLAALYKEIGRSDIEIYGSPLDAGTVLIKHAPSGKSANASSKQTLAHGVPRRRWKDAKKAMRLGRKSAADHDIHIALSGLILETTEQAVGGKVRRKRNAAAKAQSLSLAEHAESAVAGQDTQHPSEPPSATLSTTAVRGRTPIVPFTSKPGQS